MSRSCSAYFGFIRVVIPAMLIGAILSSGGCGSSNWVKNGWIDPSQTGNFEKPVRIEIRDSVSILDEPLGIQDAEEPTESDLVPVFEEPLIGPGDFLRVTIFELLAPSVSSEQQFQVKSTGYETFPMVGPVRVTGFTSRELELELKAQLRAAGILEDADVQVNVLRYESQQYSIVGGVAQPGNFPLPRPNFRLLNALAASGGLPPQAETVIVIRDGAKHLIGTDAAPQTQPAPQPEIDPSGLQSRPFTMSDFSAQGMAGATTEPAATEPAADQRAINELEILEGGPRQTKDGLVPVYNAEIDDWELRPAAGTTAPNEPGAEEIPYAETQESTATGPSWEEPIDVDILESVRVLEIPAKALREGDPRYNVVIRPSDLIDVPIGQIGEFYMYGNIARPGAYQLTGRRITVKQAIASGGGFGPLAWPSRADLIRRVGKDEEQFIQIDLDAIFAGTSPDFYLRPNDIVNVGSSPVAVFLAVARNAFRLSYGFGFVYDRNFADSDTFFAKEQVKQRRNQEALQRGLPF
ncbi:MAG TPA: SLBB domain-containing protein [Phycisphaerae bacterium]|nr:SLBB domain-containing protein [Phycisphaerae bacterium]